MSGYKSEQKCKSQIFVFFNIFHHFHSPPPTSPRPPSPADSTGHGTPLTKNQFKTYWKIIFRMFKHHKTHPKHVRTQIWTKSKISISVFFWHFFMIFHHFFIIFHSFLLILPPNPCWQKWLLTKWLLYLKTNVSPSSEGVGWATGYMDQLL